MIISSKGKKPAELQQKIIVKCLSYNLIISPVWEQCPGCCRLLHTAPCLKDRHRPDTGWSVETIHSPHSLYSVLYTVSMVTSHGHILQCLLQLLLTCRPGEWIYYIMYVLLIIYHTEMQTNQQTVILLWTMEA